MVAVIISQGLQWIYFRDLFVGNLNLDLHVVALTSGLCRVVFQSKSE